MLSGDDITSGCTLDEDIPDPACPGCGCYSGGSRLCDDCIAEQRAEVNGDPDAEV